MEPGRCEMLTNLRNRREKEWKECSSTKLASHREKENFELVRRCNGSEDLI